MSEYKTPYELLTMQGPMLILGNDGQVMSLKLQATLLGSCDSVLKTVVDQTVVTTPFFMPDVHLVHRLPKGETMVWTKLLELPLTTNWALFSEGDKTFTYPSFSTYPPGNPQGAVRESRSWVPPDNTALLLVSSQAQKEHVYLFVLNMTNEQQLSLARIVMPNTFDDARICMGDYRFPAGRTKQLTAAKLQIRRSEWNTDLYPTDMDNMARQHFKFLIKKETCMQEPTTAASMFSGGALRTVSTPVSNLLLNAIRSDYRALAPWLKERKETEDAE